MNHYTTKKVKDKYFVFQNRGGSVAMIINKPDKVIGDIRKTDRLIVKAMTVFEDNEDKDSMCSIDPDGNYQFVYDKCKNMSVAEWIDAIGGFTKAYFENDKEKIKQANLIGGGLVDEIKDLLGNAYYFKKAHDTLLTDNSKEVLNNYQERFDLLTSGFCSNDRISKDIETLVGEKWNVMAQLPQHQEMLNEICNVIGNAKPDLSIDYTDKYEEIKRIGEKYGCIIHTQENEQTVPVKKSLSSVKNMVAEKKASTEHTEEKSKSNGR